MTDRDTFDRWLREVFEARSTPMRSGESCPKPQAIWDAVRLEAAPGQRRAVGLHVVSCPACAEAWRLAADVSSHALGKVIEYRPPSPAAATEHGWGRVVAAVAAILLGAVLFSVRDTGRTVAPPVYRADVHTPIRSLLPDDRPVPRESCVLRWEGPQGSRYDVRVATDDLDVLAEAFGLETGEFVVPPASLSDLPAGTAIVWQVHADLPDGTRLASAAFRLEIR
jgi:hypothetical protein